MSYVVPQVLINQLISEVSNNTVRNQNVLVIGPQYELRRYTEADEKSKTAIGSWDGFQNEVVDSNGDVVEMSTSSDGTEYVQYPGLPDGTTPDAGYAKVFVDNAFVKLTTVKVNEAYAVEGSAGSGVYNVVRLAGGAVWKRNPENTGADAGRIGARDIAIGDAVAIPYKIVGGSQYVFTSKIVDIPAVTYSGSNDKLVEYTDIVLADSLPDEVIGVEADNIAYYEDSNDAPLANTITADVSVCAILNGVEIPKKQVTRNSYNWNTYSDDEHDEYGVTFGEGLKVAYDNWGDNTEDKDYTVVSGDLYVQYRSLVTTSTGIETVASTSAVTTTLGTVDADNPLAFGAYMALLNSGDRVVYYSAVPSDDLAGYESALGRASLTRDVYNIVPLTQDQEVIDGVNGHVESMSSAKNKGWRIGFVSQPVPANDPIYNVASNPNGVPYMAKFSKLKGDPKDKFSVLTFWQYDTESGEIIRKDPSTRFLDDLRTGDVIRVHSLDKDDDWDETPGYTVVKVRKVLSNNSVLLDEPVEADETKPYVVDAYRVLTRDDQVKYIASQSRSLASRRMYNVFPTQAVRDGKIVSGEFIASAVAGLVSSVLPQQPVTNVELNGIDDIPLVYRTYTKEQLDTIAEGGTLIVMQDMPGSEVYVRHQISTAYKDNNLLTAELSVTKNLDSISYYFAEMFAPFIGRYNITPELLDVVRSKLEEGLASLESSTAAGLYGPQIIEEGTEILSLEQDPVNKDHIKARVRLNLPLPFNYFDLSLEI